MNKKTEKLLTGVMTASVVLSQSSVVFAEQTLEQQLDAKYNEILKLSESIKGSEKGLSDLKAQIDELKSEYTKLLKEEEELNTLLSNANDETKKAEALKAIDDAKAKVEKLNDKIETLTAKLNELGSDKESADTDYLSKKDVYDGIFNTVQTIEDSIETVEGEIESLKDTIASKEGEISANDKIIKNTETEINDNKKAIKDSNSRIEEIEDTWNSYWAADGKYNTLENEYFQLRADNNQYEKDIASLNTELDEINQRLSEVEDNYQAALELKNEQKKILDAYAEELANLKAISDKANDSEAEAQNQKDIAIQNDVISRQEIILRGLNTLKNSYEQEIRKAESRITQAQSEITRLGTVLQEKEDVYNTYKETVDENENTLNDAKAALSSYEAEVSYQDLLESKQDLTEQQEEASNTYNEKSDQLTNMKEEIAKKGDYEKELADVESSLNSGSGEFLESNNYSAASDIVKTGNGSKYYQYTNLGADGDATSLDNMLKALDYIDKCNEIRRSLGLNELLVSPRLMAVAQINTNASAIIMDHTGDYNTSENLAFGATSPEMAFNGWYDREKAIYDAAVLDTEKYPNLSEMSAYEISYTYRDLYQQIGHYLNIVNPDTLVTGFAISNNGSYSQTSGQEFATASFDTAMTTSEFRNLVINYKAELEERSGSAQDALDNIAAYEQQVGALEEEVSSLLADKESIENDLKEVDTQLTAIEEKRAEYQTEIDDAQKVYDQSLEVLHGYEEDVNKVKEDIATQELRMQDANDDLTENRELLEENSEDIEASENLITQAEEALAKLNDEKANIFDKKAEHKTAYEEANVKYLEMEEEYQRLYADPADELEAEVNRLNTERSSTEEEIKDKTDLIESNNSRTTAILEELDKIVNDTTAIKAEQGDLEEAITKLESTNSELQKTIDGTVIANENLKIEIEHINEDITHQNNALADLNKDLEGNNAELKKAETRMSEAADLVSSLDEEMADTLATLNSTEDELSTAKISVTEAENAMYYFGDDYKNLLEDQLSTLALGMNRHEERIDGLNVDYTNINSSLTLDKEELTTLQSEYNQLLKQINDQKTDEAIKDAVEKGDGIEIEVVESGVDGSGKYIVSAIGGIALVSMAATAVMIYKSKGRKYDQD